MSEYYENVKNYFNHKAEEYDDVDHQLYWVLSDMFYKEVLKRELAKLVENRKELRILDAGAGTGRWTLFFQELFGSESVKLSGTLIDISEEMLRVAKRKISKNGMDGAFATLVGNIEKMPEVPDDFYDISLSFYNVLSFVENPKNAVTEINKKLKKGGVHVSVVGNTYHSLYFSILTSRIKEIDRVMSDSKIAFNDLMPPMHCFTPGELKDLYSTNGFSEVVVLGGPNFIYPGMEETFVKGQTEAISSKLGDDKVLEKILDLELSMYRNPDVVGRANTLIAIAKK